MTAKSKAPIATANILVAGKPFMRGKPITGVPQSEVKAMLSIGRAVTPEEWKLRGEPVVAADEEPTDGETGNGDSGQS